MTTALAFPYAELATEQHDRCELCHAVDWTAIAHEDRAGFPAQSVMCRRCGLCWITPRLSAEAYAAFYKSGLYREIVAQITGKPQDRAYLRQAQQFYAEGVEGVLAHWLDDGRPRTLLDVGGSTGVVAAHLAGRFGMEATVVDPCTDELAEAAAAGCATEQGIVEAWYPGGRTWDVIGIFQSFDHFLEPAAVLSKLRGCLAHGGLFIVDIVDLRMLLLDFKRVERAVKIDHPFAYTEHTMASMLIQAGFQIVARADCRQYRKVFFVCQAGPPLLDRPKFETVVELFGLARLAGGAG